ncbi:lathosterol oxidase-like [Acanthaster planci]|uniref:Lathosterol oxidase-like n=1 Tax=Acanthaster planci TaxID=133434 RepID=A0A8B7Z0R3_ACAPL|nr:lathosterol oxidase-like [Acanthaster planci]
MEDILYLGDKYFYTPYIYPEWWPEDDWKRQLIGILIFNWISQYILYFVLGLIDYFFVFDHRLTKHPLYIKDQMKLEIKYSLKNMVFQTALFAPIFLIEVRGYSRLHQEFNRGIFGPLNPLVEIIGFLCFTDFTNYWFHRFLHHRLIYKRFHKQHHMWKVPTPFSGYALHPVDGFLQGVSWHIFPFLFPFNSRLFICFFLFVLIWTVSIHDNLCVLPKVLQPIINGAAHHTDHHMYYNYNYGQFTTLWDRVFGSHRVPGTHRGKGPLDDVLALGVKSENMNNGNSNGNAKTLKEE